MALFNMNGGTQDLLVFLLFKYGRYAQTLMSCYMKDRGPLLLD